MPRLFRWGEFQIRSSSLLKLRDRHREISHGLVVPGFEDQQTAIILNDSVKFDGSARIRLLVCGKGLSSLGSVSYTQLTLPTTPYG